MQASSIPAQPRFTRKDLERLAAVEGEACLSIYMPTEQATATGDEARIRFKNLLRQAEKAVAAQGWQTRRFTAKIAGGWRLLEDKDFWRRRSKGLAVFVTPESFQFHQLPIAFEEGCTLGRRFRVRPLIPLFTSNERFHVLALSKAGVRLLACTAYSADEIVPPDLPGSIDDVLGYDRKQSQLQYHTGAAAGGGTRPAMFHGQGVSIDDHKDEIRRYFQRVDQALAPLLKEPEVPLILAGVDYLLPIYRETTNCEGILKEAVTGNPDTLPVEELHQKALAIVRPELERRQREALARYRELAGKGNTAAGVQTVVPAAVNGRVDTLFVALEARRPGTFDRSSNQAILSPDGSPEAEDLLDLATVQTIRHAGRVYALDNVAMPAKDAAAAAILRF